MKYAVGDLVEVWRFNSPTGDHRKVMGIVVSSTARAYCRVYWFWSGKTRVCLREYLIKVNTKPATRRKFPGGE